MYRDLISIKLIHANQFRSFEFAKWNGTIQNQAYIKVDCSVPTALMPVGFVL